MVILYSWKLFTGIYSVMVSSRPQTSQTTPVPKTLDRRYTYWEETQHFLDHMIWWSLMSSLKLSHFQRSLLPKRGDSCWCQRYFHIQASISTGMGSTAISQWFPLIIREACPNCPNWMEVLIKQHEVPSVVTALFLFLLLNVVKKYLSKKTQKIMSLCSKQSTKSQVLLSGCPSAVLLLACNLSSTLIDLIRSFLAPFWTRWTQTKNLHFNRNDSKCGNIMREISCSNS